MNNNVEENEEDEEDDNINGDGINDMTEIF